MEKRVLFLNSKMFFEHNQPDVIHLEGSWYYHDYVENDWNRDKWSHICFYDTSDINVDTYKLVSVPDSVLNQILVRKLKGEIS